MTLTPEDLQAIGDVVAAKSSRRYLDTRMVAELLGVTEAWVRANAADFGAMRLGDGRRSPLRFDSERVHRAMRARTVEPALRRAAPRRRRHAERVCFELLPFPTRAPRATVRDDAEVK